MLSPRRSVIGPGLDFTDKDYGICNTSVCKAGDRYVMSIEVNSNSKVNNGSFACRFLESKDLIHWTL